MGKGRGGRLRSAYLKSSICTRNRTMSKCPFSTCSSVKQFLGCSSPMHSTGLFCRHKRESSETNRPRCCTPSPEAESRQERQEYGKKELESKLVLLSKYIFKGYKLAFIFLFTFVFVTLPILQKKNSHSCILILYQKHDKYTSCSIVTFSVE